MLNIQQEIVTLIPGRLFGTRDFHIANAIPKHIHFYSPVASCCSFSIRIQLLIILPKANIIKNNIIESNITVSN
jgi:hypothetical protein